MYHRRPVVSLLILAAAALAGCYSKENGSSGRTKSSSSDTAGSGSVQVSSVTFAELDKEIHAKKGKIVVIDVWATW